MKSVREVVWHPFQGLWNRRLVKALGGGRVVEEALIFLDSVLLCLRALARRASAVGPGALLRAHAELPADVEVLYFDLGTHLGARELRMVAGRVLPRTGARFRAYGFEANPDSFREAAARTSALPAVTMVHAALARSIPEDETLRLYMDGRSGEGDSIHRESPEWVDVPAVRLSDWIEANEPAIDDSIVLLRMNIEGAEFDVLRDLVESGLAAHVDGFFGMWDDVGKIDPERERAFLEFLDGHSISGFTFNQRDLGFPLRRRAIVYALNTALLEGQKRLEGRR